MGYSSALILFLIPLIASHTLVKRQGDESKTEIREVATNVYSFTSNGFVISLIMVTSEGVIVIDPMDTNHAKVGIK